MPNFYQLMTLQYGFVMDVFENNSSPGTEVDGYTKNSPPNDTNQWWWFEPGPDNNPGYFYIRSKLSPDLCLDITGGKLVTSNGQPSPLQIWTKNSPDQSANQLWNYVPQSAGIPIPQGYIQSLLAPNHVIDLAGGAKATPGTGLIIFPLDSPVGANQIWLPIPDPNNEYSPVLESIEPTTFPGPVFAGVRITGSGFHPGSSVFGAYNYIINETASLVASGSFFGTVDLGETFVAQFMLMSEGVFLLNQRRPGTLELFISLSTPQFPQSMIVVDWDGRGTFTPN